MNNPFVARFIKLVRDWNAEGFAEYMLWRAVEGNPVGVWADPTSVTVEVMEVLRTLRDDLNIWPFWSADIEAWETVSVAAWRQHAHSVSLNDLIQRHRRAA